MPLSPTTFILKQSVTSATPLLLAGFGELLAERAGVIDIGIEGLMLMGAIAAYSAAVLTGSAWAAIPASIAAGMIFASLFAAVAIWCRADQIVTGAALNILAFGASTTLWHALQSRLAAGATPPPLFEPLPLPFLHNIPILGPILFEQYALFYFVIALAITLALTTRTRFGLIIKSLGDAPEAADAAGISVRRYRTALALFAGATAGLAGAYLSTMRGHSFQVNMTGGQGFLVLALVIFGRWKLLGLIAGTLLFGALDALQSYLAAIPGATTTVPHQLFDMLPYAATLIALALLTRSRAGPLHLALPWPPDR
ncbi:MAG: ABC transporter permease [Phycisphaerae bacterium]